jgi:hypothetical protein
MTIKGRKQGYMNFRNYSEIDGFETECDSHRRRDLYNLFGSFLEKQNSNSREREFARSFHDLDKPSIRWLWYWIGFGDGACEDVRKFRRDFLIRHIYSRNFIPLVDTFQAEMYLGHSSKKFLIRLSSSKPGYIAVTYKKKRIPEGTTLVHEDRICHFRLRVTPSLLLSWNDNHERCRITFDNLKFFIQTLSDR